MAFLTLEDLVGSMEIVVFPRDYEKNAPMMQTDARVFIQGRVSAEDDKPSKLICEKIFPFAGIPKELDPVPGQGNVRERSGGSVPDAA